MLLVDRARYRCVRIGQVGAFRSAAAVLAPHGAALTSMLHCPKGTAIFELMHANNVNRMW